MKIMLVDDNPLIQQVISLFLTSQGNSVDVAASASDALSLAHDQRYDLLLIDLHLIDQGGADLLATLRQQPEYARIPAIAISGMGEEHRLYAQQDGFNHYLAKPIDLDELLVLINGCRGTSSERIFGV